MFQIISSANHFDLISRSVEALKLKSDLHKSAFLFLNSISKKKKKDVKNYENAQNGSIKVGQVQIFVINLLQKKT